MNDGEGITREAIIGIRRDQLGHCRDKLDADVALNEARVDSTCIC